MSIQFSPRYPFCPTPQIAEAATSATFTVPSQPLAFGEHLRLVGSAPELGGWDPSEGLALEWAEGDNWTAEASLAAGAIEFKVRLAACPGDTLHEDWSPRPAAAVSERMAATGPLT